MIHSLLAIDPGAKTGWAWYICGTLVGCGVVTPDQDPGTPKTDMVVIENPQIYPYSPARPADILTLARIVGRYEERYGRRAAVVKLVHPHEWKGSIDGDIMCKRIEAATPLQDRPALLSYKGGYRHNMIDAVGIGRWALKQPFVTKDKTCASSPTPYSA